MHIYRCQLCNASINKLYFRDHLMHEHKIKNEEYIRKTEEFHKQKFFSHKVTQTDKKSNTSSKIARISPSTPLALTGPSASVYGGLSGSLPVIRLSHPVAVPGSTTASRPVAVLAPSSKPVEVAGPSKSQSVPGPKPEAILRPSLKPIAVPLPLLTNTEPSNQLNTSELASFKSKTSASSSISLSSPTSTKVSSESLSNNSSHSSSSSNTGLPLDHGSPSTSSPINSNSINSIVVDTPIASSSEPLDGGQDTLDAWSPPVSSPSKEKKDYQGKFRKFLEDHLSGGEKRKRDHTDKSFTQPVQKKCKITICPSPNSYLQDKTDILREKRKVLRESSGEIREDQGSLVSSFSSPTKQSSPSGSSVPCPGSDKSFKTSPLLVGSRERSSSNCSGSIVTVHQEGLNYIKGEPASRTQSPNDRVDDGLVEDGLVEDGLVEDGLVEDDLIEDDPIEDDLIEDDLVGDDLDENGLDEDGQVKNGPIRGYVKINLKNKRLPRFAIKAISDLLEKSFDEENSNRTRSTKPNQIDKLSQKSGASVHPILKVDVKIPNHPLTLNQLRQAKRDMKARKKPILKVSVPQDNESERVTDFRVLLTPVRLTAICPANDLKIVGKRDIHRNHVVLMDTDAVVDKLDPVTIPCQHKDCRWFRMTHKNFLVHLKTHNLTPEEYVKLNPKQDCTIFKPLPVYSPKESDEEEETNLSIQRYLESLEPSTQYTQRL